MDLLEAERNRSISSGYWSNPISAEISACADMWQIEITQYIKNQTKSAESSISGASSKCIALEFRIHNTMNIFRSNGDSIYKKQCLDPTKKYKITAFQKQLTQADKKENKSLLRNSAHETRSKIFHMKTEKIKK